MYGAGGLNLAPRVGFAWNGGDGAPVRSRRVRHLLRPSFRQSLGDQQQHSRTAGAQLLHCDLRQSLARRRRRPTRRATSPRRRYAQGAAGRPVCANFSEPDANRSDAAERVHAKLVCERPEASSANRGPGGDDARRNGPAAHHDRRREPGGRRARTLQLRVAGYSVVVEPGRVRLPRPDGPRALPRFARLAAGVVHLVALDRQPERSITWRLLRSELHERRRRRSRPCAGSVHDPVR